MITLEQLLAAVPQIQKLRAAQFIDVLNKAMSEFNISTPLSQAAFLAEVIYESGYLNYVEENLNYSADALMKTWPKRFPDLATATPYAHNPQKLANKVYALRMGNGDESSGEGYAYRGAGLIQITGKDMYLCVAKTFSIQLNQVGAWLHTNEGAARASAWYFSHTGALAYADKGDFDGVCDVVNIGKKTERVGDAIGYDGRLAIYNNLKKILKA